jgi:hypothetical protein
VVGRLRTFAPETASESEILGLNGDPLGVNGSQIGVLKERYQISLASLLQSKNSGRLEAKVGLKVLSDLAHEPLEWELADEQLGRLLVPPDFTEGDCARSEAMRLLHTSGGGGRNTLSSLLGSELLARSLASCRLTSGLLSTSHLIFFVVELDGS